MLYPDNFEQKIGFGEIRSLLHSHCLSPMGHERVDAMQCSAKGALVRLRHSEVGEFLQIMAESDNLPLQDFYDLRPALRRLQVEGTYIDEAEIWDLGRSLLTLHAWVGLIRTNDDSQRPRFPALEQMAQGVFTFSAITRRVEQIVDRYGRIKDEASPALYAIRQELHRIEGSISHTLQSILRAAQQQGLVEKDVAPTLREGRLVIPVAPAMKRRLRGIVHDESASGKTVYIEPAEVVEANNRIRELQAEERREVIQILRQFSDMIRPNLRELWRAFAFLADVEFVRSRAMLARQIGGVTPEILDHPLIDWVEARHPILELTLRRQGKRCVPLSLRLDQERRILVISGPNAGGKSVCLKTVGLLQYMLQCGIPVPMRDNSRCGIFARLSIDIGDEQSIEDDLSTYSSHLLHMKQMMRASDPRSLVLIDEFGSGTEPTIGGAFAQAMMQRFVDKGAFGVVTTHYQNLKQYAEHTPGVINGAMLYDRQRMQALFQLQTGHPGSSFAVEIARKIGIPEDVIADATALVGQDYVDADKYLLDITRDKRYWEGKRQAIHSREKQMQQTLDKYEREITELQQQRRDILGQAREEAARILQEANARVENTIREIREAQADKERTREARQQMEALRQQMEEEKRQEQDERIARKIKQIEERRERQQQRKSQRASRQAAPAPASAKPGTPAPLQPGDSCRIKGQTTIGILERVDGHRASVRFGMMRTTVDIGRLVRATPKESPEGAPAVNFLSRHTQDQVRQKHLEFHPEIDVRGMRADEALQAVQYYIDDALLVSCSRVRILHGTGTGVLRQLIRQYLATVPQVRQARDEHVQFGGAGVTVVEM